MTRLQAYACTFAGAAAWGLIGLFLVPLYARGFTAWDAVAIRAFFTFVLMILVMAVFFRDQLRTRLRDHIFFAGTGILSVAFFNFFYFEVFARSSLSVAVTLLYTGPIFVTLLSRLFFKEKMSPQKVSALFFAIVGCAFVVGLLPSWQAHVTVTVFVMGIFSGFCYALYSIFGKAVSGRYTPLTITTYTFLYTAIFMLLTSNLWVKIELFTYTDVWVSSLLLAIVSTILGYILYTAGLTYIQASRASILATVEPIVAVLSGVLFLGDILTFWQAVGILLVLYSAILVARPRKQNRFA